MTARMSEILHEVATRIIFGKEQHITIETDCELFTFVDDGFNNDRTERPYGI